MCIREVLGCVYLLALWRFNSILFLECASIGLSMEVSEFILGPDFFVETLLPHGISIVVVYHSYLLYCELVVVVVVEVYSYSS